MPGGECACPGACVPGGDVHALEKGAHVCSGDRCACLGGGHAWHACPFP